MRFLKSLTPFLLCLSTQAASSFREVLRGLPDGGYISEMMYPGRGRVNVTDLEGKPVPGSPFTVDNDTGARRPHTKMEDTWGCVEGEQIDWDNWWASRSLLDTWCNDQTHMLLPHHIYSWQFNDSAAFICNNGGVQNCLGQEYNDYMEGIPGYCGALGAGWYYQAAGDKFYGRGVVGGKSDPFTYC
ncbi:hypothetical protein PG996_006119 [Apiospora saccharicola]|uniref:Uncharacterized protein n=1 Tax=Apiospora saccharicola TaxID=335842 RepID=A0ABR1VR50_9PEZI